MQKSFLNLRGGNACQPPTDPLSVLAWDLSSNEVWYCILVCIPKEDYNIMCFQIIFSRRNFDEFEETKEQ